MRSWVPLWRVERDGWSPPRFRTREVRQLENVRMRRRMRVIEASRLRAMQAVRRARMSRASIGMRKKVSHEMWRTWLGWMAGRRSMRRVAAVRTTARRMLMWPRRWLSVICQ